MANPDSERKWQIEPSQCKSMAPKPKTTQVKWKPISGSWQITRDLLSQTNDVGGPTCICTELGFSDFNISTSFTVKSVQKDGNGGEAKMIFSDADKNELYRVDFMGRFNLCRVTMGGLQALTPFHMIANAQNSVRLSVKRNFLSLRVNGMRIFRDMLQFGKISDGKIGLGTYQASVSFTMPIITPYLTKNCFIVMQFDDVRDFLYEDVITPVLNNHPDFAIVFHRADKLLTAGKITAEIDDRVQNADLIIADITGDNPNVFYELGLAHAAGRNVILLKQKVPGKRLRIPFDIKDFRVHTYRFSSGGFADLKRKLPQIITNTIPRNKKSSRLGKA